MDDYLVKESNFRAKLRKSLDSATGQRRDELYVLATALWFEKVKQTLDLPTPYAVEHYFELDTFRHNNDGDPFHNNKWSKYATGLHRPVNALVTRVERKVHGSASLLKHPLWDILRKANISLPQREKWFQRLDGDIQRIAVNYDLRMPSSDKDEKMVAVRQLRMLERRAGIDALAALTALMFETQKAGRFDVALDIGDYIYRVLLITCLFPPFRRFVGELFDCFQRRVFADLHHGGERIFLPGIDYEQSIEILSLAIRQYRNMEGFGFDRKDVVSACIKLLDGKAGFDVRYALATPRALVDPDDKADETCKLRIQRVERLREWGINTILSARIGKFPPQELY